MARPLTARQQRFVEEYLVDCNATAAARRAGYKDPNKGRQLVTKSNVAAAIAALQAARSARVRVTADDVVKGLQTEALYQGEGTSHAARVTAWSWLGRHLALFVDRHEITHPDDEADRALDAELALLAARRPAAGPDPGGNGPGPGLAPPPSGNGAGPVADGPAE
jgi:phage terminase small subunit